MIINGVTYSFTYDIVGNFPNAGEQNANKVPPALRGKPVGVIETPVGNFFFVLDGSGTQGLMNQVGNGNLRLQGANSDPPGTPVCFCAGTDILTPSGNRKVETLRAGDLVLNDRGAAKQLIWVEVSTVSAASMRAHPYLRPIRIPAGAFGRKCPHADLDLSPQHRIVIEGPLPSLLFGAPCVLAAAKHLVGTFAEEVVPDREVTYHHLLLEDHDILVSNGIRSESFQPARPTIEVTDAAKRELLLETLAALGTKRMLVRKDAHPSLKSWEARTLADALLRGDVACVESASVPDTRDKHPH